MRQQLLSITLFLILFSLADILFAGNKFTTISAGVASSYGEKIRLLQVVGMYAGAFLGVSAVGLLAARKKLEIGSVAPSVMLVLGAVLFGLRFV